MVSLLSPSDSAQAPVYIMVLLTLRVGPPTTVNQRLVSTASPNPIQLTNKFNHHGLQLEPRGPLLNPFLGFICVCEPCPPSCPPSSPVLPSPLLNLYGVGRGHSTPDTTSFGAQASSCPLCPGSALPHCVSVTGLSLLCHVTKTSCVALVPAPPECTQMARAPELREHLIQPWYS